MGYFGYGSGSGTTWSWVNEIDGAETRIYTQDSSGNSVEHLRLAENEINFNISQQDLDFRVESAVSTHALFVRASDSRVGINQSNPTATLDVSGSIKASGDVNITGRIGDSDGDYGSAGQVLSSTGTGTNWVAASSYTLPEATSTTRGGIELFSDTDQSVAANAVSATAGKTYGIQLNSAGQTVVNVPWTDTTYTLPEAVPQGAELSYLAILTKA